MQTRISTFLRGTLSLLDSHAGFRETVGKALTLQENPLKRIKIESIVENLIGSLIAGLLMILLTSLLFKPLRSLLKKFLRWLISKAGTWFELKMGREGGAKLEEDNEKLYLGWLKADLAERSKPIIVKTPAHTKKPLNPLVKNAQRPTLLRYDTDDYQRNPDLKESDLSTRAEFGRGTKIDNLAKELKRFRKIVVLGEPGAGKSVCLRQLAYDLCEEGLKRIKQGGRPRTLPIHLEMGSYDSWEDKAARKPTAVIEFLERSLRSHPSVSEARGTHPLLHISERLKEILRAGRATVIFDALDEMPQDSYRERYDTLKRFVLTHEAAEDNRFIFSCRLLDYDPSFHVNEVIIDRFDLKRIRAFLQTNAPDIAEELYHEILKDKDLEKLVSNPFFLQALTYINLGSLRDRELLLPLTSGELIKQFAETLLKDDVGVKQEKHLTLIRGGLATLRGFLSELAFALQERREGRTSAQPSSLEDVWKHHPHWKRLLLIARRARILGKLSESSDLLVDADPPNVEPPPRIEFMHHRLQEYFAAEELGKRLSQGEAVEQYLEDIWWQETVVFAVGVMPEPRPIIKRMLSPRDDAGAWFDKVLACAGEPLQIHEKTEDTVESLAEIEAHGKDWRAEPLDLPVTLLFLSRFKRALAGLDRRRDPREDWNELKVEGQSLARRRALFVAAEAVGHLRRGAQVEERETIRKALGVVVEEGTTLLKVRALRALSFIPSDECIPILESGLQDRSPWVQATALHILFHMNLRQRAPRKVLTDFLFDTFRRQTRREVILKPKAIVKNFHVSKGLFAGLLKVPGGKLLALLSLRLWLRSILMTVLIALQAATSAVFIKLPRAILSTPDLARKMWAVVYWLVIQLPYTILCVPLWARKIKISIEALRERYFYLALLDYAFFYLLVVAGLPHGAEMLALALGIYWILLAISMAHEDLRSAERFRLFMRCACAVLLAWFTQRSGQDKRLTLALIVLAAVHGIWVLPMLARAVRAIFNGGVLLLADLRQALRKSVASGMNVKGAKESPSSEMPPRQQLLREVTFLASKWFRLLRRNLRPRLKGLFVKALIVVLTLAAAYYALMNLSVKFLDPSKLMGPRLDAWLGLLKFSLYFLAGGWIMAIPCVLFLAVFHVFWDELWIIERVRFRLRSRNPWRFRSINDFLAYVFHMVRDSTLPTGLRVRAAFALTQVPLASQAYVDSLTDLAEEEGLPISVSDAVSQAVEDAEKRAKRGQPDKFEIDIALVNRQLEDLWKPGEVLRPWIFKVLSALLLSSLLVGAAQLYSLNSERITDMASLACLVLGCIYLLLYIHAARKESELGKWPLLRGLILLISVFTRPLQASVYNADSHDYFSNGVVKLVDISTFSAWIVPLIVIGIVVQVGHTVYLLGSDVDVEFVRRGELNIFERKLERLRKQRFIMRPMLLFALCSIIVQSQPLQDYHDHRHETIPVFAPNGNEFEVELKGIPTDGRVVRIAMIEMENQSEGSPSPGDDKISSRKKILPVITRSLKDGGLLPVEARTVWGDVWFSFQDGKIHGWWTSPIRCLKPSGANGDVVTFNLHSLCSYDSKVRLVAVVYDKRRSDFIKNMPVREGEEADVNTVYPSDSWLVTDTFSPFVRAVWSPVF